VNESINPGSAAMPTRKASEGAFEAFIRRGHDLLKQGDLREAMASFQSALADARCRLKAGGPTRRPRLPQKTAASAARQALVNPADEEFNKALASISACHIELGEFDKASRGLREIILRSSDDETICAAAYNLSIALRRQGQFQKAFTYARKAFEKSKALQDVTWMARCYNLIGNIHLVQSHLDKALQHYRKALSLRLSEKVINEFSVAILRDNIGYCMMLRGDYDAGIEMVRQALDAVTRLGSKKCLCECAHDLSFGLMQLRRLDEAETYGKMALEIAEAEKYHDIVKNCFYLLGEINYLKGDEQARDHYFYRLQELYPNLPFLRDFLCTFDVSKIIALRFPQ
jgi:tetratricopeptide (TPR) repeat protein